MNRLPHHKRVQILKLLVEGNSIRGTARVIGCAINTVSKLQKEIGKVCLDLHDELVQNVKVNRMQVDEVWSFVYAKDKNAKGVTGRGDKWTWTAIDSDTKLVVNWHVGSRDMTCAHKFMDGTATRISNNPIIASDGLVHYIPAVRQAFGENAMLGQLCKIYNAKVTLPNGRIDGRKRYIRSDKIPVIGNPQNKDINTAHIERQNLTMRMHMRRFTRKTNAFSKKFENHCYAIALNFVWYNFMRIHTTIKTTPAIKAGVIDYQLTPDHLIMLLQYS